MDGDELSNLLQRTLDGDLDAFGEVVARFQDMAFGCAFAVLGDFHEAQDATQEAFITAYTRLTDLRDLRSFPGWLRRLVLTACNRITRRRKLPTTPLEEAVGVASPEGDPAPIAESAEMRETVLAAIRSLPPANRMATTLFYINGYSIKEVAEFLEVPAGTVKYRLHESRAQLKERMVEMVKEELAAAKPTTDIKERVMTEVGLGFPPGIMISGGDPKQETTTFYLSTPGAATQLGAVGLIGLTFDQVATYSIVPCPLADQPIVDAAKPRCELLDLVREILLKSGVKLDRVVLDVGRGGQVSAVAVCHNNGLSHETAMPASVALALAYRMKVKVLATPKLMQRGGAGEGFPPKDDRRSLAKLKREILKHRVRDELLDLAWQNGLDPDAGSRSARYRVNQPGGTIEIYVSRRKAPVAVVDLIKYRDGVEMFRRDASTQHAGRLSRKDKVYRLSVQVRGDEIRCEVTRVRDAED